MRRLSLILLVACSSTVAVVGVAHALALGHAAPHRHVVKHATSHGLSAPGLVSPSNGAHLQQVPALTWNAVAGGTEYEYEIAADPSFHSIVLGSGTAMGSSTTHNLAATLGKSVTDGTYYWRVRGLTKTKERGPWSSTRSLVKAWTEAPSPLGPADGAAITWPSVPLVLRWTPVASATEYIVTISTDPALSNTVVGSASSPTKTWASVYALPGTLPAGRYWWAITPVDAAGHRGARSGVRSFEWSWPTNTATRVTSVDPELGIFEPQFSWDPVPGAARYEVQVNTAEGFPVGSMWCCEHEPPTLGTSLSPTRVLNNTFEYYWRVRAIDASGNAGVWNEGPKFQKNFDAFAPSIPNLGMSNTHGEALAAGVETETPIVTWSPVPGAASYEVQVSPYTEAECHWGKNHTYLTSTLAWTPLGSGFGSPGPGNPGPATWPTPRTDNLPEGVPYCVRVLARSDRDAKFEQVIGTWTYVGGEEHPAFTFRKQKPPAVTSGGIRTPASAYLLPAPGFTSPRTPLFTWKPVEGASYYYVVIARDSNFTNVVDVAVTNIPAYAPPLGGEEPLADETSSYYWAVLPIKLNTKGEPETGGAVEPKNDAPQLFNKQSVPPTPIEPVNDFPVSNQPTFSWSPAEGALNYTLQVSQNETFGTLIDNVKTDSTSYTSSSTYPANATLYWRVRANDADEHLEHEGLNWSPTQTFRRTLPAPSPSAGNPTSGQAIPILTWDPVPGATAYEVHGEQPDGSTKEFTFDSTAFTASEWDGPGIWRWQVRALFPTSGFGTVPGPYFAPQPFAHTMDPPAGAVGVKSGSRIVISWEPEPYAKEYEIQIATTDTFTSPVETHRIERSSWAPNVDYTVPANRGTLYWRVASIDNRGNVGPYAEGRFVAPRPRPHCTVKRVRRGRRIVKVCVVPKHH
jgi:hypothetical protein